MTQQPDLPAGEFSAWLRRMRSALVSDGESDVPCGECVACCVSSHFVHIGREEAESLAAIPRGLVFPAPDLPRGNVVLGYDKDGRCPMLTVDGCSIYEHRPATCRVYDCRVFAAAGVAADEDLIDRRASRWRFSHPSWADRDDHAAVRAAARFLQERADCLPGGVAPRDPVHVAVLAVNAYNIFLTGGDASGEAGSAVCDEEIVRAVLAAEREFEHF